MMLTPIVRIFAVRLGWVDKGGTRKVHDKPIPRVGGIAIFFSFLIPFGGFVIYQNQVAEALYVNIVEVFGIVMAALMVFLMGLFDDIKGARARFKLLVEILAACLVYYAGVRILKLSNPFGEQPFTFNHFIGLPFTVFWIVGVTNAVNLSDGIDGLAAGLSSFIGITLFIASMIHGHTLIALLSITLVGSTVGFLVFNFPPAKIFMGDSGALFLGFTLASVSILGSMKSTTAVALVIPILAMIVPIADTLMAMARRYIQGKGMMEADKDHVHHRLMKMGMSNRQIIITLYIVTAFFGLIAISTLYMQKREVAISLGAAGLLIIMLIRRLGYKEFKVDRLGETLKEGQEARKRTKQEREIIKEFETEAGELDDFTGICKILLSKVKALGYQAVEISPTRGSTLFEKGTGKEKKGIKDNETSDSFSFFWIDPDLDTEGINITWYLEISLKCGGTTRAKLKVYKDEPSEAQKIHDEVILELLGESVSDVVDTDIYKKQTPTSKKKKKQ